MNELYNLPTDPIEAHNLYYEPDHRAIVEQATTRHSFLAADHWRYLEALALQMAAQRQVRVMMRTISLGLRVADFS